MIKIASNLYHWNTGGTLCKAAGLLKDKGAISVTAYATHGVFSEWAMENINESVLEAVYVTDTIRQEKNLDWCDKLHVLSISGLLAEAIRRIQSGESLSVMFE